MKDFVSNYWTSVVGAVAAMSIVTAIFGPFGVVWGLAWASLVWSAALLLNSRSTASMTQIILDVEAEPTLAAVPVRAARYPSDRSH
jgi:hypothetical protein